MIGDGADRPLIGLENFEQDLRPARQQRPAPADEFTEYATSRLTEHDTQNLTCGKTGEDRLAALGALVPAGWLIHDVQRYLVEGEPGYKALKSVLDGSVAQTSDNLLIYATSNRRHLLPEYMKENLTYTHTDDGEVHPGEVIEEKISLSERFGLWLSFYPFSQDEYLAIVAQWLRSFGVAEGAIAAAQKESLVWALERGSRSGRVAWQFARDYAGRGGAAT